LEVDKNNNFMHASGIFTHNCHIPKTFGGGFRHHDFVQKRTIDKFYRMYKEKEKKFKFDTIKQAEINERLKLIEEDSQDNETRQSRLEF
jgi:hypothetical protein